MLPSPKAPRESSARASSGVRRDNARFGRCSPVGVNGVDVGENHEQLRFKLASEHGGNRVLVDDCVNAFESFHGIDVTLELRRRRRQ